VTGLIVWVVEVGLELFFHDSHVQWDTYDLMNEGMGWDGMGMGIG
jgi:hypothetical protein